MIGDPPGKGRAQVGYAKAPNQKLGQLEGALTDSVCLFEIAWNISEGPEPEGNDERMSEQVRFTMGS